MNDHNIIYIISNNKKNRIFEDVKKNIPNKFYEEIFQEDFSSFVYFELPGKIISFFFEVSTETINNIDNFYNRIVINSDYILIFLITNIEEKLLERLTDLKHYGSVFSPFIEEKLNYVIQNSFKRVLIEKKEQERQENLILFNNENKNKLRELDTIFKIYHIVDKERDINRLLTKALPVISKSFKSNKNISIRISFMDIVFTTENFLESSNKISIVLINQDGFFGNIELFISDELEKFPFSPEELDTFSTIRSLLSKALEGIIYEDMNRLNFEYSMTIYSLFRDYTNGKFNNKKTIIINHSDKRYLIISYLKNKETKGLLVLGFNKDNFTTNFFQDSLFDMVREFLSLAINSQEYLNNIREINEKLISTQSSLIREEKLTSISRLAAGVTLELNNPIGFIDSNFRSLKRYISHINELFKDNDFNISDELKEKHNTDLILEDLVDILDESNEGFKRIIKIINSLRSFSRIDNSKSITHFDLNESLKTTLIVAGNEIKYKAHLHTYFGNIPLVYGITDEINQVLLNLLVNASQAVGSDDSEQMGNIHISTSAEDSYVICRIKDDGPGIKDEDKLKIFDPFFTTKPVGEGTGLGLSISYDIIVNKHNGDLFVENNISEGAEFVLKLPLGDRYDSSQ